MKQKAASRLMYLEIVVLALKDYIAFYNTNNVESH